MFDIGKPGHGLVKSMIEAVSLGVGRVREELRQPFRVLHRDVEADDAAVAPAHERYLADLQIVQQSDVVGGHEIVSIGRGCPRGSSVPSTICDDNSVLTGQVCNLVGPYISITKPAMNQQDRCSGCRAINGIVHLNPVYRGSATPDRHRHGRWLWKLCPAIGRQRPR